MVLSLVILELRPTPSKFEDDELKFDVFTYLEGGVVPNMSLSISSGYDSSTI